MIDHLVLATPDVATTARRVREEWGVGVVAGGAHVGRGTRNELTGLGSATYLEIVGPDADQPAPAFSRPFGVDDLAAASLVAWCARPLRPLPDVVGSVAALGIDLGEIIDMTRTRPDGVVLQWQLTLPLLDAAHRGTTPFLIDWLASAHPSDTVPQEAVLEELHITHPSPDLLRAVLHEVGASDVIELSAGAPRLQATVRTPRGRFSL